MSNWKADRCCVWKYVLNQCTFNISGRGWLRQSQLSTRFRPLEWTLVTTMSHYIISRVLLGLIFVVTFGPACIAQISEYQECSDGLDLTSLDENLTAEERIELMDARFNAELSDTERCEVADSGASDGASETGSGAGGTGGNGSGSSSPTNPNSLEDGQRSVAVNSDMTPSSTLTPTESGSPGPVASGNNGKDHEALARADNKKALADSILKRAEQEEDPVIKAALMKRYKELTQ